MLEFCRLALSVAKPNYCDSIVIHAIVVSRPEELHLQPLSQGNVFINRWFNW